MFDKSKLCKRCGASVLGKPKHCPACGAKMRRPFRTVLIVLLCLMLLSAIFGESPSPADPNQSSEPIPSTPQMSTPTEPNTEPNEAPAHTHTVSSWATTLEPTCTSEGQKTGTCTDCKQEITQSIPKIAHVNGDWVITRHATPTSDGEKSLMCKLCSQMITTLPVQLSAEDFKGQCQTFSYKEIARYPDNYDGKLAMFTGEVIQVMETSIWDNSKYTLRVDVTPTSYGYTDTIYVSYTAPNGAARILENDIVTMYGTLSGTVTYETVLGARVTIPSFDALYIEIQK